LVFALVGQCSPPVRPINWIVVPWQRIRTAGRVLPSAARITVALADLTAETTAEPKKVLVNVLRAVHQAIDGLIGRPPADTTAFPVAVMTLGWTAPIITGPRPPVRQRIERQRNPLPAAGTGSPSATRQTRCP
jgi:hypothetical protein